MLIQIIDLICAIVRKIIATILAVVDRAFTAIGNRVSPIALLVRSIVETILSIVLTIVLTIGTVL